MKDPKRKKGLICLLIVLGVMILLIFDMQYFIKKKLDSNNISSETELPQKGEKELKDYTWEEFNKLSGEQQIEFQNSFGDEENFEKWMNNLANKKELYPWEKGEKQPKEYTWEEFNELNGEQQIAFQNEFKDTDEFEEWMDNAKGLSEKNPWEKGEKQPEEYTWEEFNELSGEQQIAFQNTFKDTDEFEKWMENAQSLDKKTSWEKEGKQPKEYTWEEFNELSGEQQIEFQNAFKDISEFEEWMKEAQGLNKQKLWKKNEKNLNEYTWEEFNELSGEEQIAFQNTFKDINEFEKWMEEAQSLDEKNPWEKGGKQPKDYTWEEFLELSGEQQIAFQNAFEDTETFEEWMKQEKAN